MKTCTPTKMAADGAILNVRTAERCRQKKENSESCNKAELAAYFVAKKRYEEPNRVLTLGELQELRETTNAAIPCELRMKNGKSRIAYIAPVVVPLTELYADGWQYKLEEISAEHRTEIYYNGNTVLSHILPSPLDYGVKWRCWLRYPEKFELEKTPWEES